MRLREFERYHFLRLLKKNKVAENTHLQNSHAHFNMKAFITVGKSLIY